MPVTAWSTYVGCVVGSAKIPGSNLNQALTCREDANSSTTLANNQFHQVIVKLWKVQHKLEPQTTRFQSKSCAFWNVLVAAERHKFLLWKQIFSDSGLRHKERKSGVFAGKSAAFTKTTGDHGNLLMTKAIIRRFLLQQPLCSNLQQPVAIQSGNACFFLAAKAWQDDTNCFLGLCDRGLSNTRPFHLCF